MREDLLGYLLGALEPDEVQRIEELLASDPELRAELRRIEDSLRPLETEESSFEPPRDLISNTLAFIDDQAARPAGLSRPQPNERSGRGRWRMPDAIVAAISLIAVGGLVFPAILEGRFEARRSQCQDNLRVLGTSLTAFAMENPSERYPEIPLDGPLAFAGSYAMALKEQGLMERENAIWCGSRNPPLDAPAAMRSPRQGAFQIPARSDIEQASPSELAKLQRIAGGHMAYTLGVMEEDQYRAPRFQSRTTFPIIGDAPIRGLDGMQTPHDGRGYNLYFEDGSVRFLTASSQLPWIDNPFANQENKVEAGLHINDASLGESARAPFVWVHQADSSIR